MPNFTNQKYYLTTKHTKDTKVSDIDISKLLNFVLFVTFVVKSVSTFRLRLCRAVSFVVQTSCQFYSNCLNTYSKIPPCR